MWDYDNHCQKYIDNDVFVTEKILREQFIEEEKEMNYNSKAITLIGSMSEVNKAAMIALHNRLTYKGNNVSLPYMDRLPEDASDEQIKLLHDLHESKMSDANLVIVVDADGHIGKDTQREIDWCNDNRRNIIYLSDMQVYDGDFDGDVLPMKTFIDSEKKQTKGGKRS